MSDRRSKKKVVILGATGSIGGNAIQVCRNLNHSIEISGLAAGRSTSELATQARAVGCQAVAIGDPGREPELRKKVPSNCRVLSGEGGMIELCTGPEVDMVLCAISGTAGLKPVLAAIEAGKDIALASKEILVMAGSLVMAAARRRGIRILPVDSEHSAIFQCLQGEKLTNVDRLILTASGGPFRDHSKSQLLDVTWQDALAHPTWQMGEKITIDSATLMNKGLELIEASWMFGLAGERIEVILHPQSIIHSMAVLIDGSVLAQMGNPDMRLPIQYALTYPERAAANLSPLDFSQLSRLEFMPPRNDLFPALDLARKALSTGGTMPAVFNAANEAAVEAFRREAIGFLEIFRQVERVMTAHQPLPADELNTVLKADQWAREYRIS